MRLHRFLTTPTARSLSSQIVFWFSLSLTFAAIYGLPGLQQAFSSEYVVQDDARQHVFWMRRFLDAGLFPNDLIADYFQSVAPLGYTSLYRLFAAVGIDPLVLSKLLPIVLGLITTGYCFGVCLQMLPVPLAGFLASLLLNQYLWLWDDLVSATPVAFVYPLFVAFLYYLLRRSLIPMCVAIALLGLFYPQCVFICAGILFLQLLQWKGGRPRLSQNRSDYLFCGTGIGVALLLISIYALKSSSYGPAITAARAKTLLEFGSEGSKRFFVDNPWAFWFTELRSGIMPRFGTIVPLVAALLLPLLLSFPSKFPLLKKLTQHVTLLVRITLVSLGMFFVAHALLFKLYLPSRYTEHSLRVVTAIAAGIALTVITDAMLHACERLAESRLYRRQLITLGATILLGAALILQPSFLKKFPKTDYVVGGVPALYEFFSHQPKDILIASLVEEVGNLPSFAKRSVLVGREFALPYHIGYYTQIRQRTIDLIDAQYSPELNTVRSFIQKYGIDFWLVNSVVFTPDYLVNNPWIWQYQPVATQAKARLEQPAIPALSKVMKHCSVFEIEDLVVLQSACISQTQVN